jgi:glyoxylase-like metal-dependent hydrolase (beta-lactamase superfamily II)
MSSISPEDVTERTRHGDESLLLLDIRHADEFEAWNMPDSVNVDVYDVLTENPENARDAFQDLPSETEIVTVCGVGAVSATATEVLNDMGYDAKTLEDGLRGWSRVHHAAPVPVDIPGTLVQIARPGTGCLSYVLISGSEAVVIDPSQYVEEYERLLEEWNATLTAVLETHAHADHISGADALAAVHAVPHYLHPDDVGLLGGTTPIDDGDELVIGDVTLRVVHTPGHTPGSVTFAIEEEVLLTGDTLFLASVGRPDLDSSDEEDVRRRADVLFDSLQRLRGQPADTLVAPAHDPGVPDPSTIAPLSSVRDRNELLGMERSEFVDSITGSTPETPPNHDRIKRVNTGQETIDADEAQGIELGPNRCAAE